MAVPDQSVVPNARDRDKCLSRIPISPSPPMDAPPPPPSPPTPSTMPVPGPSTEPTFDSSWPKRTAKACSNCRRDKTRCDGARPCGGCAKKSLQCLDGCEPCRRARARCEKTGGNSCVRCDQKELVCTDESNTTFTPINPTPAERAKSACKNCRNDNKKCDNQRPCSRCVARSETCVPFPRSQKPTKTRCEGCRKRNVRCEDTRPCQNCVTSGTECISLVRKGPGCGNRVKAACINCRRNKVKCDGERPCAGCTRRNLQCQEQVCKRCGDSGLTECTHRGRMNDAMDTEEPIASTSQARAEPASPPAAAAPHPVPPPSAGTVSAFAEPSMFAPLSLPPVSTQHSPISVPLAPPPSTEPSRA
ncbi:hypothetical protein R3P38DRAFT_2953317 [Favolaschia claudopus]|uniref:Transcription activator of gluconeogenesis ERT1 n=1 Tax=Favolaschia claudopus TaxID=2862362 RepID=A0AAW0BGC7_9AGAR